MVFMYVVYVAVVILSRVINQRCVRGSALPTLTRRASDGMRTLSGRLFPTSPGGRRGSLADLEV